MGRVKIEDDGKFDGKDKRLNMMGRIKD